MSLALVFTVAPRLTGVDQAYVTVSRVAAQRSTPPTASFSIRVEEDLQPVVADVRPIVVGRAVELRESALPAPRIRLAEVRSCRGRRRQGRPADCSPKKSCGAPPSSFSK